MYATSDRDGISSLLNGSMKDYPGRAVDRPANVGHPSPTDPDPSSSAHSPLKGGTVIFAKPSQPPNQNSGTSTSSSKPHGNIFISKSNFLSTSASPSSATSPSSSSTPRSLSSRLSISSSAPTSASTSSAPAPLSPAPTSSTSASSAPFSALHAISSSSSLHEHTFQIPSDRLEEKRMRKLTNKACIPCRRSHLGCDLSRPCSRCVRRGMTSECKDSSEQSGKKRKRVEDADAADGEIAQLKDQVGELEATNVSLTNALYDMMKEMEEMKEALKQEREAPSFRSLSLSTAVVTFDPTSGIVQSWNTYFLDFFQYSPDDMQDPFHFSQLLPFAGDAQEEWQNLMSHPLPTVATNILLRRKDRTVLSCMLELDEQRDTSAVVIRMHIRSYMDVPSQYAYDKHSTVADRELIPSTPRKRSLSSSSSSSSGSSGAWRDLDFPSEHNSSTHMLPRYHRPDEQHGDGLDRALRQSTSSSASGRWSASEVLNSDFGRVSMYLDSTWREHDARRSSHLDFTTFSTPVRQSVSRHNPLSMGSDEGRRSYIVMHNPTSNGHTSGHEDVDDSIANAALAAANALSRNRTGPLP